MRVRIRAALFLCAASLGAPAGAQNYPVKDATGATQTMASKLNGGINFPEHVITDPTGAHGLSITTSGAAMVDGSGVTQPVSIAGSMPGFTTEPTFKLDQTAANNGVQVLNSVAVTGTFWQGTQPVSIAALPLPTGAMGSSGGTVGLVAGSAVIGHVINDAGSAVIGHVVVDTAPTTAVTGTFFQTTQPVSIATAPALVASTAIIGKVGIDQATPGSTNGTQDAEDGTTGSAVPAKAGYAGASSSGNLIGLIQADKSVAISVSTASATQLVALTSGKAIYVTAWDVVVAGADNVTLEYGTGTACATGTAALTGAYNLGANGGLSKGIGLAPVLFVPAGNALCIVTSAAVQASGSVSYTQE